MSAQPKWLPSDEEIATAINEYMKRLARKYMGGTLPGGVVDDLQDNPVVGLIDRAVEKALAEQEAKARRATLEEAARAVCRDCSAGIALVCNEYGEWVHYDSDGSGPCDAEPIHDLIAAMDKEVKP